MSLRLPGEIVAERFVPTARAMLARELADRGETRRDIAAFLGVTQAAVSNYVSGDAPTEERFADDRLQTFGATALAKRTLTEVRDCADAHRPRVPCLRRRRRRPSRYRESLRSPRQHNHRYTLLDRWRRITRGSAFRQRHDAICETGETRGHCEFRL